MLVFKNQRTTLSQNHSIETTHNYSAATQPTGTAPSSFGCSCAAAPLKNDVIGRALASGVASFRAFFAGRGSPANATLALM